MILPTILHPFADGAAPAVMLRIALDSMGDRPAVNGFLDEVSKGQDSREILLRHFIEVMAEVDCGFWRSPHARY